MRTLADIIIGALVFITIDRFCKVISSSIVNVDESKQSVLKIELFTLIFTVFIAVQF